MQRNKNGRPATVLCSFKDTIINLAISPAEGRFGVLYACDFSSSHFTWACYVERGRLDHREKMFIIVDSRYFDALKYQCTKRLHLRRSDDLKVKASSANYSMDVFNTIPFTAGKMDIKVLGLLGFTKEILSSSGDHLQRRSREIFQDSIL